MIRKYQIDDLYLCLGDIGSQPVVIEGEVHAPGDPVNYYEARITAVIAHLTLLNGEVMTLDITHMITRAAMVSLREAVEQKFEADVA